MKTTAIGDLAASYMQKKHSGLLKTELTRLTQELASGQVSDVKAVMGGNYSYLTDIQTSLTNLDGYKISTDEATQYTGTMQLVLGQIQETIGVFSNDLISISNSHLDEVTLHSGHEALGRLTGTLDALNTQIAGRSLFSGAATNQTALKGADVLMEELKTLLTGVTGSSDKIDAINTWFNDPAGFDATMYNGSDRALAPFQLSNTQKQSLDVKAIDPAIKDTIKNLAIAAISAEPSLGIDFPERKELLFAAGEGLLFSQDGLTGLRAKVGNAQARIETISTRNASERTSLEYAKGTLLAADPYEIATRLEEVQFQLQSLYTLTVKTSQLSLVNYL